MQGPQAYQMGARVPPVLTVVRIRAVLLSPCLTRRAETPPPLGFNFNRGANHMPCIITDNTRRGIPAHYTRVIMGPDPHVIGIIPSDRSQYSGPPYTIPDHDQGECLRYAQDDLWHLKYGANKRECFNNALDHIHDLSLTTEVARFHESSCLFLIYQEEVCKIEECMWEASQLKDASARRLEGANALDRIEAAAEELDHRAVPRQVHMECGFST